MEILVQFGLVLLLVLLNGYFVASEFSIISSRRTKISEMAKKGNRRAKLLLGAIDNIGRYISATQLGVTLSSLALGWIGEPAVARVLEPLFEPLPTHLAFITANTLAVIIGFTLITFLHIVLGELVPKSFSLQKSEKTSLMIITPLFLFTQVFKPFIWLLNTSGQLVLRLFGVTPGREANFHSEEEIKMLLQQSSKGGVIPSREVEMVYNVFQLGDIPVRVIMVPRTEVLAFSSKTTLDEIAKKVENHPHSRFPIYNNSIDDIRGFVHVKDLYRELMKGDKNRTIGSSSIIRETITVPEMKKIDTVLQDMRKQQVHLAVVNDEFGGTAGIITLEDILESLVGEIQDEFDRPMREIIRQKDGTYTVDGHTLITDFQERFKLPMRGQGYTTIGGLVFGLLGHEPEVEESVQIGNLQLTVSILQGKRIKQLTLKKLKKNSLLTK